MNRVDVILSERELERLTSVIDRSGAPGYSVARHITGRGAHGLVASESLEVTGLGANVHVIIFCEEPVTEVLRTALRPLLAYYGGVAFVSICEPI